MSELFDKQVASLENAHFQVLYWTTVAEDKEIRYNITNVFDDLKNLKITRTKQSAVAYIDTLKALSRVNFEGVVTDNANNILTDFNSLQIFATCASGHPKDEK